eukprot:3065608-Pyramimonas_sp.AAC.1
MGMGVCCSFVICALGSVLPREVPRAAHRGSEGWPWCRTGSARTAASCAPPCARTAARWSTPPRSAGRTASSC